MGRGLSPGPSPFLNITSNNLNTKLPTPYDKEHWQEYWLADMCQGFTMGEVRGSNPTDSHKLLYNHMNKNEGDTWRPPIGPRVSLLFDSNRTRVNLQLDNNQPIQICHIISATSSIANVRSPCQLYGLCHVATVRTVPGTVSIPFFCLFGSANRSR
jgi:hypothetical protein